MLKKILAILLAAFMLFTLTACGGTGQQPGGAAPGESESADLAGFGFQNAADAKSFVDNFNAGGNGYAYLVESDADVLAGGTFRDQGYSVYRILIWSDKDTGSEMEALGDFTGKDPNNNLNLRLIYDPQGQLVLFKTLLTVSNSANVAKSDNAFSCDALAQVLAALFPQNTEEQNQQLWAQLCLPAPELIDSFAPRSDYESSIDLIEHFFAHCGYEADASAGDLLGGMLEYEVDGKPYRLICSALGESQDDLYALYWDISFATPEDMLAYEGIVTVLA